MTTTDMHLSLLDNIRIASPCPVSWESMTGDERTRHCAQCNLKVHNLSAMTRDEAEALLAGAREHADRFCARLYRRADGTVLTRDCPVGLARLRAALRSSAGRIAAGLALLFGLSALPACSTSLGVVCEGSCSDAATPEQGSPMPLPQPEEDGHVR